MIQSVPLSAAGGLRLSRVPSETRCFWALPGATAT